MSRSEREAKIKDKAGWVITVLAAILTISTLLGNSNSSKIMTNTIAANNQWSWYQAKNVRQVLYETAATESQTPDHKSKLLAEAARMEFDKKEIMEKAKSLESERDLSKNKSKFFTYSTSVLQISLVLLSASILAVSMPLFWMSIVAGGIGSIILSQAVWLWF